MEKKAESKVIPFKKAESAKVGRQTLSLEEVLKQVIEKNTEIKKRLAKKRSEDNQNVLEAYRLKD